MFNIYEVLCSKSRHQVLLQEEGLQGVSNGIRDSSGWWTTERLLSRRENLRACGSLKTQFCEQLGDTVHLHRLDIDDSLTVLVVTFVATTSTSSILIGRG